MQNTRTSESLHLWGHSTGSAVSWDVFRGLWHCTTISGKFLWRGVLARALVYFLCLPACFQVPARSATLIYSICYRTLSKTLRNFVSLGAGRSIGLLGLLMWLVFVMRLDLSRLCFSCHVLIQYMSLCCLSVLIQEFSCRNCFLRSLNPYECLESI